MGKVAEFQRSYSFNHLTAVTGHVSFKICFPQAKMSYSLVNELDLNIYSRYNRNPLLYLTSC